MARLPSKEELIMHISGNSIHEIANLPLKNQCSKSGKTLLHLAAKYSPTPDLIYELVYTFKLKAGKFTRTNKRLAIHIAAKYGKLDIVQILYSIYPKSIESKDYIGNSPLATACKYNQPEIAKFLISSGASMYIKNKSHLLPVQICLKEQHYQLFMSLVTLLDNQTWACIYLNCLQLAVKEGYKELVTFILERSDFKDKCIFTNFFNILKLCKNEEAIEAILEHIKENNISRLIALLTLRVSSKLIMRFCENELRANSIHIATCFDRADLLQEMYYAKILKVNEILAIKNENLKEKCMNFVIKFRRWQSCKSLLFTKKYCTKDCIKRLPDSLVNEISTYI